MNLLTKITWPQYLLGVVCVLVFYYVYVALRYYVFDLKVLLSRNRSLKTGKIHRLEEDELPKDNTIYDDPDETIEQIENLISEIKACIANAAETNILKGDFQNELKQIVARHPEFKGSPYEDAMNELILSECDKHGITTLNEDDCEGLWLV